MDTITVPYKAVVKIATFEGDWTAEQIDSGEAGEPRIEEQEQWYEPINGEFVIVTDPDRIAELESTIQ